MWITCGKSSCFDTRPCQSVGHNYAQGKPYAPAPSAMDGPGSNNSGKGKSTLGNPR